MLKMQAVVTQAKGLRKAGLDVLELAEFLYRFNKIVIQGKPIPRLVHCTKL
uniref:Uncharacterized protein n=1 Tax=Thermosporothrix sp. COM3 TaxID=2490863 RepID=A0A455SJP7_9CHLR|nr:hypothetical protein KTC_19300 [Thermosporothrix sp. COM3]